MIEYKNAVDIVLNAARNKGTEHIPIRRSLNRVLAADVISDSDIPSFDKSAMDGFACRSEDLKNPLSVIETIAAGQMPAFVIKPGTCAKIMTGAMIPEGADCVIKVEDTHEESGKVFFSGKEGSRNIRYRGEETKKGDVLIPAGILIKPRHISVLASVGLTKPEVFKQPLVAIISTGDELVEPEITPKAPEIRNTNAIQLLSQLKQIGVRGKYLGIVGDDKDEILNKINFALESYDVILISGGVSMGDFDYVPNALKDAGFELLIRKISVKPGKPVIFGVKENSYCFGLPGNPVSSFVQFEILVKPFLFALQGHTFFSPPISYVLRNDCFINGIKQLRLVPVKIYDDQTVESLFYKGSAHSNAVALADGLMEIPIGVEQIKKGEIVNVRLV